MSRTSPALDAGTPDEKPKIRVAVEQRRLVGAANDLKWGVLLDRMRERDGLRPSNRWKCVEGPGWILAILDEARRCYELRGDVVRIFGYLPKNYDGLDDAG